MSLIQRRVQPGFHSLLCAVLSSLVGAFLLVLLFNLKKAAWCLGGSGTEVQILGSRGLRSPYQSHFQVKEGTNLEIFTCKKEVRRRPQAPHGYQPPPYRVDCADAPYLVPATVQP
jgi:hypothetical protein